jgi:hypothetical protein
MPKAITALCAVVIGAGFIVLSGAVLVLRADVVQLQHQLDARPASQAITCAALQQHVQLRVHGKNVRCVAK